MSEAKKELKKRVKIRDSHRAFVRKTIAEAKKSIDGGGPVDPKRLKSIKSTLKESFRSPKDLMSRFSNILTRQKSKKMSTTAATS